MPCPTFPHSIKNFLLKIFTKVGPSASLKHFWHFCVSLIFRFVSILVMHIALKQFFEGPNIYFLKTFPAPLLLCSESVLPCKCDIWHSLAISSSQGLCSSLLHKLLYLSLHLLFASTKDPDFFAKLFTENTIFKL